jgi:hypothetical protein
MPKTAVGLFENRALVEDVVVAIEALGFPRNEVRTLKEPITFDVPGVMSFPRLDFEVDLARELTRMGAGQTVTSAYVEGLRRGGALVFATGSDENVDAAIRMMNQHGAVETDQTTGPSPQLPQAFHGNMTPMVDSPVVAGRIRQSGGACCFVW